MQEGEKCPPAKKSGPEKTTISTNSWQRLFWDEHDRLLQATIKGHDLGEHKYELPEKKRGGILGEMLKKLMQIRHSGKDGITEKLVGLHIDVMNDMMQLHSA